MIFVQISFVLLRYYQRFTPPKTNMRMKNQPFEDVPPIEDTVGIFQPFRRTWRKSSGMPRIGRTGWNSLMVGTARGRPLKMKGWKISYP